MDFTEIDAYVEWCKENCTNALYKGIELSAENYKKAAISMSECERQPVGNNEQGGNKLFDCPKFDYGICLCELKCEMGYGEIK